MLVSIVRPPSFGTDNDEGGCGQDEREKTAKVTQISPTLAPCVQLVLPDQPRHPQPGAVDR